MIPWLTNQQIKEKYQRKALKKKACFPLEEFILSFLKMANYGHKNVRTKGPEIPREDLNFRCSN